MPSSGNSNNTIVPIGIIFLTVGCIILTTAALIWFFAPQAVPEHLQQAGIPPTPVKAIVVTPTSGPDLPPGEIPILLPETPLNTGRLPSLASVENAPRQIVHNVTTKPVRLVIPSLAIDASIRQVGLIPYQDGNQKFYQWEVPAGSEVGWHENSAPLGLPGNTVLNGHNNIYGEVFRDLIEIGIGEQIIIYDAERTYSYQVTQQELMPENGQPLTKRVENAGWIQPTDDERITLVSCWPYATNDYRLVVVAKPVSVTGS